MSFIVNPKWNWLRWVLIVPVALISWLLVEILVNFFSLLNAWFIGASPDSPYLIVAKILAAAFGGFYFVFGGSMTAPNKNRLVAILLFIILLLIGVTLIIINLINKSYEPAVLGLSYVIGGGFSVYKSKEYIKY
jgi:hypothetical protein